VVEGYYQTTKPQHLLSVVVCVQDMVAHVQAQAKGEHANTSKNTSKTLPKHFQNTSKGGQWGEVRGC